MKLLKLKLYRSLCKRQASIIMLEIVFPEIVHYFVHLYHREILPKEVCVC